MSEVYYDDGNDNERCEEVDSFVELGILRAAEDRAKQDHLLIEEGLAITSAEAIGRLCEALIRRNCIFAEDLGRIADRYDACNVRGWSKWDE